MTEKSRINTTVLESVGGKEGWAGSRMRNESQKVNTGLEGTEAYLFGGQGGVLKKKNMKTLIQINIYLK